MQRRDVSGRRRSASASQAKCKDWNCGPSAWKRVRGVSGLASSSKGWTRPRPRVRRGSGPRLTRIENGQVRRLEWPSNRRRLLISPTPEFRDEGLATRCPGRLGASRSIAGRRSTGSVKATMSPEPGWADTSEPGRRRAAALGACCSPRAPAGGTAWDHLRLRRARTFASGGPMSACFWARISPGVSCDQRNAGVQERLPFSGSPGMSVVDSGPDGDGCLAGKGIRYAG